MENVANLGLPVLPHPLYSPNLLPSDFRLFGPMKDGLHGQHFPSYNTIRAAVKQCVTSAVFQKCRLLFFTGENGSEFPLSNSGSPLQVQIFMIAALQTLVRYWRKCVADDGAC